MATLIVLFVLFVCESFVHVAGDWTTDAENRVCGALKDFPVNEDTYNQRWDKWFSNPDRHNGVAEAVYGALQPEFPQVLGWNIVVSDMMNRIDNMNEANIKNNTIHCKREHRRAYATYVLDPCGFTAKDEETWDYYEQMAADRRKYYIAEDKYFFDEMESLYKGGCLAFRERDQTEPYNCPPSVVRSVFGFQVFDNQTAFGPAEKVYVTFDSAIRFYNNNNRACFGIRKVLILNSIFYFVLI